MKKWLLSIVLLWPAWCWGQEPEKLQVGGYVKDMVTWNIQRRNTNYLDNLIHHRLNMDWYISDQWEANLELRNRLFVGDLATDFYPLYADFIDVNNDYFDLSWMPVNEKGVLLHSMIDRMRLQWHAHDWEVTVGRQRINWGKNLVWNPNDIFNTYSFFDFDYEERPGSDAIHIKKYVGFASGYEVAIKMADSFETLTAAALYAFNWRNYDIQLLSGVMQNNWVIGSGWAGNLGNAGFKGEVTYFEPLEDSRPSQWMYSVSVDYSLSSGLYFNGSMLYNSLGASNPNFSLLDNTQSNIDVRSLSPFRYSTFLQVMYPVNPLLSMGLSTIYYPSDGSMFWNPVMTYSVKQNLDLDIIGQLFFAEQQETYAAQNSALYLRLKYSY